jgi:predicted flap endonuclease-1-like 5' DNA nuclease
MRTVSLYDLETGEELKRRPITAQEAVLNDPQRFTMDRPAQWPPKQKVSGSDPRVKSAPVVAARRRRAAAAPKAKRPAGADDLTEITGVGPKVAERMNAIGIHTFADLARQQPEELSRKLDMPGKSAAHVGPIIDEARKRAPEPAGEETDEAPQP